MNVNLDLQAEILSQKIKHYLITTMGRTEKEANELQFFQALSYALREEVMINWSATQKTFAKYKVPRIYYLSMEYLPGRILGNNISNLHAYDLVKLVSKKMNHNLEVLLNLEPDPGLGNGGLGRLASCFLDSLATQNYAAMAYGLRYQYGIFEQQLWEGVQIEKPDLWLLNQNPWEMRNDYQAQTVKFSGHIKSFENAAGNLIQELHDYEEVRALPFDFPIIGFCESRNFPVITLRLWSTKESPHNFHLQRFNAGNIGSAGENTGLTDVLYPNDNHETGKRIRLKQEFLLVSASVQDILRRYLKSHDDFADFADKIRIQINDTHPSLAIIELLRIFTQQHGLPWKQAVEIVQNVCGYTNHTIMKEALEEWNQDLLAGLLPRQYGIIDRLNLEFCNQVRKHFNNDEEKVQRMSIIENRHIRMAHLAIVGSHKVNGVAKVHSEILKTHLFKDFYEMFPDKFVNVTNGVTQRHWLFHCNPDLAQMITDRIGSLWVIDFKQIRRIESFAEDERTVEEFLRIKQKNKINLIEFLKSQNKPRDIQGKYLKEELYIDVDSNALFDVQIKRMHEYKRQVMNILNIIMIYHDLLDDTYSRKIKRVSLFSGKASAGYQIAKEIIRLIFCLAKKINQDKTIQDKLKVVFIENYGVSKAELIIPAADLSQQISTAGLEASGTGNMKLTMNGALTIGTEDGANIEMHREVGESWWPFSFGMRVEQVADIRKNGYNPWDIYFKNPKIKRALDALKDGTFASNLQEEQAFSLIFESLLNGNDRFFVLRDLESYYETQKKVEELYIDKKKWAQFCIHNIAGMGPFSTDNSINNYAELVWKIKPTKIDEEILENVRKEYGEHDKCRILAL